MNRILKCIFIYFFCLFIFPVMVNAVPLDKSYSNSDIQFNDEVSDSITSNSVDLSKNDSIYYLCCVLSLILVLVLFIAGRPNKKKCEKI